MAINSFPDNSGGPVEFPDQFIDPVSKFRVSNPENLIDTDFEYGLQPTKWETVELINNTPSFFSKSGDTTIDGIASIITNAGTREIIVKTELDHGLAVGIPINVTGTKSITADGSYIINSIPDTKTFTYLCKDDQDETASILDLYSSIITGEFFQGSQLRVSDSEGIITDAAGTSELTVTTNSTHGFGENTPFYFLNLNSTVAQEFQGANTASKTFDASNSATAQTFDGSNTLSSFNIDWSNSAVEGGTVSNITSTDTANSRITVSHTAENFANLTLGAPLYYSVSAISGYFNTNPRGVVFLKTTTSLGTSNSTFQVSLVPDGEPILFTTTMSGTFQIANQARTFSGNNINPITQTTLDVEIGPSFNFDGGNQGYTGAVQDTPPNNTLTVTSYNSTSILASGAESVSYYVGAMVKYSTTGTAATGLINNATYFVTNFVSNTAETYTFKIANLPGQSDIAITGGSGTQTFSRIGVSIDKDILHIPNSSFEEGDMIEYTFPVDGRFDPETEEETKRFYFIETAYDTHNYQVSEEVGFEPIIATGGTILPDYNYQGRTWRAHQFTSVGSSSFNVSSFGKEGLVDVLVVAGGGGAPYNNAGGGGAGGLVYIENYDINALGSSISVAVGAGGAGRPNGSQLLGGNGSNSTFGPLTAIGGGGSSLWDTNFDGQSGGSGGGAGGGSNRLKIGGTETQTSQSGLSGTYGFGNFAGNGAFAPSGDSGGGGGGGSSEIGVTAAWGQANGQGGKGGEGKPLSISGNLVYYAAGGGGSGGGGGLGSTGGRGGAGRGGSNTGPVINGTSAAANTGSGGGGGDNSDGGNGGSGIVIVRYPLTPIAPTPRVATGGTITTYTANNITYRVHSFTSIGTTNFVVSSEGNLGPVEYLIVAGGGGGGRYGGGGGGGGVLSGSVTGAPGTYPIVVGAGGAGRVGDAQSGERGASGANSTAFGLTAIGGGAAGSYGNPAGSVGLPGGSGGGGGSNNNGSNQLGGLGTPEQGYNGGTNHGINGTFNAGGGGGASGNAFYFTGQGGPGFESSINGSIGFYGSGGSGSQNTNVGFRLPSTPGGGIGRTESGLLTAADIDGVANTGGGGGGGKDNNIAGTQRAGNGGSGVVILRYPISLQTTPPEYMIAEGGHVSEITQGGIKYAVHQFTKTGNDSFVVKQAASISSNNNVEYLVIGGGGGGGICFGGGGGAGGYRSSVVGELSGRGSVAESKLTLSEGSYRVTVGHGGVGLQGNANGSNGGNSVFGSITALGGGAGAGNCGNSGVSGGSGGGSSSNAAAGAGQTGQGFNGGVGGANASGGGGGGAGSAGGNGSGSNGGNGGNGLSSSITGFAITRAGGGGGTGPTVGLGGTGGGVNGIWGTGVVPEPARANTGSGGAGALSTGYSGIQTMSGSGGSGIVIIRYPIGVA